MVVGGKSIEVAGEWLPSQRVIELFCIVVEQIPARAIAASPKCFLTTFLTPKGRDYGSGGTNSRIGVPSRGAADMGCESAVIMAPSVECPSATPNVTPESVGYVEASRWPEQIVSIKWPMRV